MDNPGDAYIEEQVVRIGVMAPSDAELPRYRFMAELAEERVNTYCEENGLETRFRFVITNAESSAVNALGLTENYHGEGVEVVVGYAWNSHLNASMGYAAEKGMALISPQSTSPRLAHTDGCFRLCPSDRSQVKAIAGIMTISGVEAATVLHRGDAWGRALCGCFEEAYELEGGETILSVEYPVEADGIGEYLRLVEEAVTWEAKERGSGRVGVLLVSLGESPEVLLEAESYPPLMNVPWFGTDSNSADPALLQAAGHVAARVKLLSPADAHVHNEDFIDVEAVYTESFGEPLDFYTANVYDGCWLAALSVIEGGSTGGEDVAAVFSEVAYTHYGITGPLALDGAGDRDWARYNFYGYYTVGGRPCCLYAGYSTRLERYGQHGMGLSPSPASRISDESVPYMWEKRHEAK
ncbi:ABC transporter substrate-binding protein [Candidatus Bathyarchaeota archaeon]|nr:ABC transporter substrate-binding protein [Candidatus Bathyarchaeota archaeon]